MNQVLIVRSYNNKHQEKYEIFIIKYALLCILLCAYTISVKTRCTNESCGICGVCINDTCETKFFSNLFESSAPECKIKNHCTENKCVNSKCISTFGNYYCQCGTEFEGQLCDIRKLCLFHICLYIK